MAGTGDFRRGSVIENYRRCGKPNCACAQPDHPGHGPRYLSKPPRSWTSTTPAANKPATAGTRSGHTPTTRPSPPSPPDRALQQDQTLLPTDLSHTPLEHEIAEMSVPHVMIRT
ncbi:MAG: DUF6788 family protein [Haloechinothrix sp.]